MLKDEEKEIDAMIKLLDDKDQEVIQLITDRLILIGKAAIPKLEEAWEHSVDTDFQNKIESIIHSIQFETIITDLKKWKKDQSIDLFEGAMILARYQYPDIDDKLYKKIINKIIKDCEVEIHQEQTIMQKVKVINHILFDVYGIVGNKKHFLSTDSNFLNKVLETKNGNPLLISVIYVIVANALNIPIYGVNLPEHFILAYADLPKEVHFYLNPFAKGSIFSKREIDAFLTQLQIEKKEEYYLPCSNNQIIIRMINNMMIAYKAKGLQYKLDELNLLKNIIYNE
jgi:regulator of sirC expression with transglutaminase-like and TPR domain